MQHRWPELCISGPSVFRCCLFLCGREAGILHFILLPQCAVIYNRSYLINVKGRIATDVQAARAYENHFVSCGAVPALRAVSWCAFLSLLAASAKSACWFLGHWVKRERAHSEPELFNLRATSSQLPGLRFPCFLTGVLFRWNLSLLLLEDLHCHKSSFFPDVLPNKSRSLIRGFESKSCYHDFKGAGWNGKKQCRHFIPLRSHRSWKYTLVPGFFSCGYQNSTVIK